MTDIYEEMVIHQGRDRRIQILNSLKDSRRALEGEIGDNTREYLEGYINELETELKALGMN